MKRFFNKKIIFIAIFIIAMIIVYYVVQYLIGLGGNDSDFIEDNAINTSDFLDEENTDLNKNVIDNVDNEISNTNDIDDNEGKDDIEKETGIDTLKKIYVYVTGEVNSPGVVILDEGSRIVDAIEAAGGITNKANISKINLVYILEDSMKVNIPNDDDLKNDSNFEYVTLDSGDGINDFSNGNSSDDTSNYSSKNSSEKSNNFLIVNINTATQTELETLPGIGPSLALKIINYRTEKGKFNSIEDIKNVKGIGDSKFDDIKSYIVV